MARTILGHQGMRSNATPSGVSQGTMGGVAPAGGRRPGVKLALGDEKYLWLLVILEVMAMAFLRQHFRRYHGG